jgi:predicted membrane protein
VRGDGALRGMFCIFEMATETSEMGLATGSLLVWPACVSMVVGTNGCPRHDPAQYLLGNVWHR